MAREGRFMVFFVAAIFALLIGQDLLSVANKKSR